MKLKRSTASKNIYLGTLFKENLHLIIILLASIFALYNLRVLLQPGIPMNIDLPSQYGRIWCQKEIGSLSIPTTWCPYKNAGDPIFQSYSPLSHILVYLLSFIFGLQNSFKIVLTIIYFLLPFSAFLFFKMNKKPLAGSFAYTFLLLESGGWHTGGFNQIFTVGMFPNALGSAMFILALTFANEFFKKPSRKNTLLAAITAAMLLLSHVMVFVLYAVSLIVMFFVYLKKVKVSTKVYLKEFLVLIVCTVLLTSFWVLPFVYKRSFFAKSPGGPVTFELLKNYTFSAINKLLLIFGFLGIILAIIYKKREYMLLLWIIVLIFALWALSIFTPKFFIIKLITDYVLLLRYSAEFRTLIIMFAALMLSFLFQVKIKFRDNTLPMGVLALLIFAFITFSLIPHLRNSAKGILMSSNEYFVYEEKLFDAVSDAKARILVEDTLFNFGPYPQSYSHSMCIGPTIIKKEFLGCAKYLYPRMDYEYTERGHLFNKKITEYSPNELTDIFEKLNIEYVIFYSPEYKTALKDYEWLNISPWAIIRTNINNSYFETDAYLKQEYYDGLKAQVVVESKQDTTLLFKVRNYPNWIAFVDGVRVNIKEDPFEFMLINVPKGKHIVEFKYVLLPIDYLSDFITAFTIVFLFYFLLIKPVRLNKRKVR